MHSSKSKYKSKSKASAKLISRQRRDGKAFCGPDPVLGQAELYTHEQRKKPLKLTNGKRVFSDAIKPFLKQLMGSKTVRTQFMGRILNSSMNTRHYSLQLFRHNMYQPSVQTQGQLNAFSNNIAYSDAWKVNALFPANQAEFNPSVSGTTAGSFAAGEACMRDMVSGETYIAPLNRSDYEDMSWNLNKFKLGSYTTTGVTGAYSHIAKSINPNPPPDFLFTTQPISGNVVAPIGPYDENGLDPTSANLPSVIGTNTMLCLQADAPRMVLNSHRGASQIWLNNFQSQYNARDYESFKNNNFDQPYLYKMVFNYGSIKYDFMNKGALGSIVEVITMKFKKNKPIFSTHGMNEDGFQPNNFMETCFTGSQVIGEAKRLSGRMGTDNISASAQNATQQVPERILSDPDCPFCPKNVNVIEGDTSMKIVDRLSFAMPSGSRRQVTIALPGERYDPCASLSNKLVYQGTSAPLAPAVPFMCDEYTYAVMLVVNGQRVSQEYVANQLVNDIGIQQQLPESYIVGDGYAPYDIQFNATYSEQLSACEYTDQKFDLKVFGKAYLQPEADLLPPNRTGVVPTGYVRSAAVVQPLSDQVRVANTVTLEAGSSKTQTTQYDAEPLPSIIGTETSTCSTRNVKRTRDPTYNGEDEL